MIRLTTASGWAAIVGMPAICAICFCGPTGSVNNAPSLTPVADKTVFVGEPIDFRISATDPDGDAVAYSLSGAGDGASLDPSSGQFSWRPAPADTGEKTIVFQASDGRHAITASANFTVIMPSLGASESIRFLRPSGGEVYAYGDTLAIAFVMNYCARNAPMRVSAPGQYSCSFANTSEYWPTRDSEDSTDASGRVCKFLRKYPDLGIWVCFYKLPLVDLTSLNNPSGGCAFSFGGGTARVDSLRIFLWDPYATEMIFPMECASDASAGFAVVNALLVGKNSNTFSVAPRS